MERELRQGGLEIEIANLGAPGAGPREYAALAERAIPLLKPDLIVVAVLQADDLFQAADSPAEQQAPAGERVLRAFRAFYPNMMQMLSPVDTKQVHVSKDELREIWRKQVKDFLGQMTAAEKARFENLPSEVRQAYHAGMLNPGLLFMAMRHGEFLIETDRKSTRLNSSHLGISYAVFCFKKKNNKTLQTHTRPTTATAPHGYPASITL